MDMTNFQREHLGKGTPKGIAQPLYRTLYFNFSTLVNLSYLTVQEVKNEQNGLIWGDGLQKEYHAQNCQDLYKETSPNL